MADRSAADRACKDPNPIIDGRKANVNLAYLGAKPRVMQPGKDGFTRQDTLHLLYFSCLFLVIKSWSETREDTVAQRESTTWIKQMFELPVATVFVPTVFVLGMFSWVFFFFFFFLAKKKEKKNLNPPFPCFSPRVFFFFSNRCQNMSGG